MTDTKSPPPSSDAADEQSDSTSSEPPRQPSSARGAIPVVLAVLGAIGLGLLLAFVGFRLFRPHVYSGTVLQGDDPAPAFDGLTFTDGEPVDVGAYDGDVVVAFFGYTHCPDVCPTTMARLGQAVEGLSESQQENTAVWLVTVDPARDTAEVMETYVEAFAVDGPAQFRGIVGDQDAVNAASSHYGVYVASHADDHGSDHSHDGDAVDEGYEVDHSSQIFGIGPDGALRIIWPPTATPDQIRADIAALLD